MRVLITGSLGYVAPGVISELRRCYPGAELVGLDAGWFASTVIGPDRAPETLLDRQIYADIRDLGGDCLSGVTDVIHLAALSNDPMGDRFAELTDRINYQESVRLAELAMQNGVRNFVVASSASVYGAGADGARREDSEVAPLTAYARSKISTEHAVMQLARSNFRVTCLRFATACGWSPRIRLDLVLNDFVASAVTTGRIEVLSDGSPWRPLIHVRDMARALSWAVGDGRAALPDAALVANVGSDEWNFQIRDLAQTVAEVLGGIDVSINTDAPADKRSYQVDFSRWRAMAPEHQPQEQLTSTVEELAQHLNAIPGLDPDFRNGPLIRLKVLRSLQNAGALDSDLRWSGSTAGRNNSST